jgi:hypothetical protein
MPVTRTYQLLKPSTGNECFVRNWRLQVEVYESQLIQNGFKERKLFLKELASEDVTDYRKYMRMSSTCFNIS